MSDDSAWQLDGYHQQHDQTLPEEQHREDLERLFLTLPPQHHQQQEQHQEDWQIQPCVHNHEQLDVTSSYVDQQHMLPQEQEHYQLTRGGLAQFAPGNQFILSPSDQQHILPQEQEHNQLTRGELAQFAPGNQFIPSPSNNKYLRVPGVRFVPSDIELILDYLQPQLYGERLPTNYVNIDNVYSKHPKELTSKLGHSFEGNWYIFSPRNRKYPRGKRPSRNTGDIGFWKSTSRNEPIYDIVGENGEKKLNDWVLCKITNKETCNVATKKFQPHSKKQKVQHVQQPPNQSIVIKEPSESGTANSSHAEELQQEMPGFSLAGGDDAMAAAAAAYPTPLRIVPSSHVPDSNCYSMGVTGDMNYFSTGVTSGGFAADEILYLTETQPQNAKRIRVSSFPLFFQCASAMAGKQFLSMARSRPASPRGLLAGGGLLILLLFAASYFLLLYPSSPGLVASPSSGSGSGSAADTAFLASLDRFLASPPRPSAAAAAPGDLDAAIRAVEEARLYGGVSPPPLRVYVYEMPSKFTYDLLRLFRDSYRETTNLTSNGSPVHRLVEQHSVDYWLWADLIAPESQRLLKNVIRVQQQEEADIFYIPFFTTISYFLLEKQECKALYREALKWITDQPAWQRSEGRDHVIPVHHPWSFKSVRKFVKKAIWLLPDMDSTGNWYVVLHTHLPPFSQGGKIRSKLVTELKDAEGVVIEEGTAGAEGKAAAQNGMRRSLFCLNPAGDTPSSARLFDAIVSGCIPVIISDELELPFEGILDYRKIALFVSSSDAVQPGWLVKYLKGIDARRIREMQSNLLKIAGNLVNIKLHIRRSQRVVRESRSVCTCECRVGNNTRMF
uniref:NAC domain-containing protein n=1 Tax=Leersia perrieri TaxID=77586 RepID=A0A0D9V6Z7_9ORYZ